MRKLISPSAYVEIMVYKNTFSFKIYALIILYLFCTTLSKLANVHVNLYCK